MTFRTWASVSLLSFSTVWACSAGSPADSDSPGPDDTGSDDAGTDGIPLDDGTFGDDAGTDVAQGGAPPAPPGGVLEDPPPIPCDTPTECCDAVEGCTDPAQFICNVDHYCGLIKGTCSEQADCQGDSYCCVGDCRPDAPAEGVCIPANVPPGIECSSDLVVGEFAPSVQCEWSGPSASEVQPASKHVLTTPLVANLPYDNGVSGELVVLTAAGSSTPSNTAPGVLRILRGQDCKLVDSIQHQYMSALATPAIGDLDDDGVPEIVVRGESKKLIALKWNGSTYVESWVANIGTTRTQDWAGPSLHDLDNDGKSEVLVAGEVWDFDGTPLFTGSTIPEPWNGLIAVAADVDDDGKVELIADRSGAITVSEWNGSSWVDAAWDKRLTGSGSHFAVADFGSMVSGSFNSTVLDGRAEIVAVNDETGAVSVRTLENDQVLSVATGDRGGPPVIGDFDADGFPEFAIAGKTRLRVFDLNCTSGCENAGSKIRWSQPSQDASSAQTGATIFDFDGDGKAEVVYADECFLRVYSGTDGKVVFSSYRTSATWYESPLVADIDGDQNTEIVVNSNAYGETACPTGSAGGAYVDPIHQGVTCSDDASCPTGTTCTGGFCRCSTTADCCGSTNLAACGLTCASSPTGGANTCRATHPGSTASLTGVRVLRDRLDRWASSRGI
ncbi:MAG TPA: VCBS repeat-containing protein, partial [Polyangiaceae bacterium]|nr:VCBS repeat-containing protein [Polyangiaceae bacterium]